MNLISREIAQIGLLSILFLIVGTENLIGIHKIQLKQEIATLLGFVGASSSPQKDPEKAKTET